MQGGICNAFFLGKQCAVYLLSCNVSLTWDGKQAEAGRDIALFQATKAGKTQKDYPFIRL